MPTIHPTAVIHESARIADSVTIGPYCVVGRDVTIGSGTILHNHVIIQSLTIIGRDNQIYPFAVLGADPQDRKFRGERVRCVIGDRNRIREHVTVHRGTSNGGWVTRLGNDNLIMVASHIAHDCKLGNHVTIANQVMLGGHVRVEDGANIGGGAGVHHFVTVGSCAFIGGLARITRDVPPFMIVEGNPAGVRAVNVIGMNRRGHHPRDIEAVKDAHRRLFRESDTAMIEKIGELHLDYPDVPAVNLLCRSLAAAAEGVHGRALEICRPDDKRAVEMKSAG